MAKSPRTPSTPTETTPSEFAQVVPRDLYATSDIRFVMIEIGKLTTAVDRLIEDTKSHGDKIDALRIQAAYIKGGIAVGVLLIGLFITAASFFLSEKWGAVVEAVNAASK